MEAKEIRRLVEINGKLFVPYNTNRDEEGKEMMNRGEKREWYKKVTENEEKGRYWWEKEAGRKEDETNPFSARLPTNFSMEEERNTEEEGNPFHTNFFHEGGNPQRTRGETVNLFERERKERKEKEETFSLLRGEKIGEPKCAWCGNEKTRVEVDEIEIEEEKTRKVTEFLKEFAEIHVKVNHKIKELRLERELLEAMEREVKYKFEDTHSMEESVRKEESNRRLQVIKTEIKHRTARINEKQSKTNVLKERERKAMLKILKGGTLKTQYENILRRIRENED